MNHKDRVTVYQYFVTSGVRLGKSDGPIAATVAWFDVCNEVGVQGVARQYLSIDAIPCVSLGVTADDQATHWMVNVSGLGGFNFDIAVNELRAAAKLSAHSASCTSIMSRLRERSAVSEDNK